jgi:hypothetical protein
MGGEILTKIDFILFLCVYMSVIGIVTVIFSPSSAVSAPFESEVSSVKLMNEENADENWWDGIVDAVTAFADAVGWFIGFIGGALTLNIPGVPLYIRAIFVSPIIVVVGILIADYIRGIDT